jgi:putative ABC transport system substrate-binding protein
VVERWTGDDLKAVQTAAAELVSIPVQAILTTGSRVVPIVQKATSKVPIVFVGISDPVSQGLVAGLARPGGNTTGISQLEFTDGRAPLIGKQLELIHRLAPAATRALLIFSPENPASTFHVRTFHSAANALGLAPVARPVRTAIDITDALEEFGRVPGGVLLVPSDLTLLANRSLIVGHAAKLHLPAIYSDDSFVHSGGLVSYFADRDDLFRRAAGFVDRVLRGERPADMPVEQPTAYELTINQRTAGTLGLPIPPAILAQADEIVD